MKKFANKTKESKKSHANNFGNNFRVELCCFLCIWIWVFKISIIVSLEQRFAAVIMRIREPKTTALIFASGKMVSYDLSNFNDKGACMLHCSCFQWFTIFLLLSCISTVTSVGSNSKGKRTNKKESRGRLIKLLIWFGA